MPTPKSLPAQPPVTLPPDALAWLDEAPRGGGAPRRPWTPEEDALLLEARKRGIYWRVIAERIGCNETTARKRYRELQK